MTFPIGAMPARLYPTVVHMLRDAAATAPGREALAMDGARLDYATYWRRVVRAANRLAELGCQPGDRVALLLGNGLDIAIATFAIHAARCQCVPLNPIYTARELSEILQDAAPRVLIVDAGRAAEITPLAAALGVAEIRVAGPSGWDLAGDDGAETDLPFGDPDPSELSLLQYTGGTTGRAKGVNLTHRATMTNVAQREGLLPTGTDGERIVCAMPLFHSYALAMGLHLAAYCRGALVIRPRYHPDDLRDTIGREAITIFPGAPTIYTGLMAHPRFAATDWGRVHTCYSGSAPLPAETLARWEAAVGAPIFEGYGQTEAGPVLTFNPAKGLRKPGAVGYPVADTEVQIVDPETGEGPLPIGAVGEIRARGPQIMAGYRNLPEETAQALRDGWLYTGDIGSFDADGYLSIRDRKKDMVITGGYNVYPREVDEILHRHPAVAEAASVGVPDPYRGEVLRAHVVLKPGAQVDTDTILAHCRTNLAKYKVPAEIVFADALPKTPVGKIDRKALRPS